MVKSYSGAPAYLLSVFENITHRKQMEAELEKYRNEHDDLLKQIEQLEELEKKRKEQETRWLQARNTDNLKP